MLKLRPHHFLCIYCFRGKGYSNQFIANFAQLRDTLENQPQTEIITTQQSDPICQPCPHNLGAQCQTESKIQQLDTAHTEVLGWSADMPISWHRAKKHIYDTLTLKDFHRICEGCEWKPLGLCESVLREQPQKNDAPD